MRLDIRWDCSTVAIQDVLCSFLILFLTLIVRSRLSVRGVILWLRSIPLLARHCSWTWFHLSLHLLWWGRGDLNPGPTGDIPREPPLFFRACRVTLFFYNGSDCLHVSHTIRSQIKMPTTSPLPPKVGGVLIFNRLPDSSKKRFSPCPSQLGNSQPST